MEIVVKTLPEAVQELLHLLVPPAAPSALIAATVYLEDLHDLFHNHNGHLPGAREERAPDRGRWWWQYTNGVWVLYRVTDVRRWFRRPVRTVTIVGFEGALPVV